MTSRVTFADRLALVAILLAAIAAIAGLLVPGLYRDTADGIRQARATDLVTLLVALPALAIGLWRAHAGSIGGRFVAVAALGYLAYSYAIYAFSVVIAPFTPLHIAILGLATWSLVLSVFGLDDATLDLAAEVPVPAPDRRVVPHRRRRPLRDAVAQPDRRRDRQRPVASSRV